MHPTTRRARSSILQALCAALACSAAGTLGCAPTGAIYCENSCATARNGTCEDGQAWANDETCAPGTDCSDCGPNFDAPPPRQPGVANSAEAFGARRSSSPGTTNCLGPPPVVAGWYCNGEREFYYQGRRSYGGSSETCASSLGYYCGENRRCVTDPETGFAVGCMLEGQTDPAARVVTCETRGCCDTGVELQWCSDVPAMLPVPPNWGGGMDIILWYEMGSVRYEYQQASDPVPQPDDSGNMVTDWCRMNAATRFNPDPSQCSTGMCTASCPPGTVCANGVCVGEGALRFTLEWTARADLDLYVRTPGGNTISYRNRSADGGMLDRDDTDGGAGSVENIFFDTAANGTYEFWVDHYRGDPASFNVRVWAGGRQIDMRGGSLDPETEGGRWMLDYPPRS